MYTDEFETLLKNNDFFMMGNVTHECGVIDLETSSNEKTDYGLEIDESVLYEYAGNETKNKEFRDAMNGVKAYFDFRMKELESLEKELSDCLDVSKRIKTLNDIKKAYDRANDNTRKFNTWIKNGEEERRNTFKTEEFIKISDTFNNKYSSELMKDKKAFCDYLEKMVTEIDKLLAPWMYKDKDHKYKALKKEVDRIYMIDKVYSDRLVGRYQETFDFLKNQAVITLRDITYIVSKLHLEMEKKLSYKIINKVLK